MGKGGSKEIPETAQEIELKKIAIERWNDHQSRLLPMENAYIADVSRDPAAMQGKVAGIVNADMAQKANQALPAGVNPSSGAALSYTPMVDAAKTVSRAQVNAGQNVVNNRIQALQGVVDIGNGKAATAVEGLGSLASNAVKGALTDAESSMKENTATAGAVMSGIGAGAAMYKNYGQKPDEAASSTRKW